MRRQIGDIVFCAALMGGGAVVLGELAEVRPAPFDPLGSAAVPAALAWIIIVLSAMVMARALVGLVHASAVASDGGAQAPRMSARHAMHAALITVFTTGYVFSITSQSV